MTHCASHARKLPRARSRACPGLTALTVLVSALFLVLVGCDVNPPAVADTAPAFTRTVTDRSYTVGKPIRPLALPMAIGGNGALTYELTPEVPGLTFNRGTRTLSGTPTMANSYGMTYRVTDADDNTTANDADNRNFVITVRDGDTARELIAALESRITEFTSERGIGATAVGIMKNGEIIYDQGFGWKDKQRTVRLPENVMMRIASVTKPITAAAVHELTADGILDLGDHVFDIGQPGGGILEVDPYPSLGDSRLAEVTVQHLLQHRGGWDRRIAGDPMFRAIMIAEELSVPSPPGRENIVRYVLGLPLQFAPGARKAYSNFGYLVLGLVIEKVTGQDYMSYVQEKIFAPLGVPAADVIQGRTLLVDRSDREPWYDDGFGGRPVARNVFDPSGPLVPWPDGGWHLEAMIAHGGLVASTHAILQFLDAHQIAGPNIGQRRRSSGWWYHTGSLDGTNTLALQRDNGVNYVILFNRRRHRSDESPAYVDEMRVLIDDVLTAHGAQRSVLAGSEQYGEREADDLRVHPLENMNLRQ